MIAARPCSKPGCTQPSVATLTFNYHDSMAVLGPLATSPEPHTYDLCEGHAVNLTVPVGWQIVRLQTTYEPAPPSSDDLLALVDAVRAAARSEAAAHTSDSPLSEAWHPRTTMPAVQERPTYATVTQLRPPNVEVARPREAGGRHSLHHRQEDDGERPTRPTRAEASSRAASTQTSASQRTSPMSAAQFVASELGPFAPPRPTLPEEAAAGEIAAEENPTS